MDRRLVLKKINSSLFLKAAIPLSFNAQILKADAKTENKIKIGILIPQSGPAAIFGESCRNCSLMASDHINNIGGIAGRPIELMFADAGRDPAEVNHEVWSLWKKDKCSAFVGMHDSAVRSAVVNLFKGKVPYIYTAPYEGGECSANTFVTGETPQQQLEPVIPWFVRNKNTKRWYLIGNDYNWPRKTNEYARNYITSNGGSVVGEDYLPFSANNFDSNIIKIKRSNADIVLITLVGGASIAFNRAFSGAGLSNTVLRVSTLLEENTLSGIGKADSYNLFSSSAYFSSLQTQAARKFNRDYYHKFGKNTILNSLGQSCYEGLLFLHALTQNTKTLDSTVLKNISSDITYQGVRGHISLEHRHTRKDIYLAQSINGRFEVVSTFNNVGSGAIC